MKKIAIAALVLASIAAHAQKSTWTKEPTSVFGVALGQVLENSAIEECGGVQVERPSSPIAACSLNRPGFGDLVIAGLPVPVFEGGIIQRDTGVVTSVYLHGKHTDYHAIKTLLVEKYGRPTKSETETLKNGMGATFKSELSMWIGKSVTLVLKERSGSIDKTGVHFSHNATAVKQMQEREKSLKDAASKM